MAWEDNPEYGELPSRPASGALATTRVAVVINSSDQLAAASAGGSFDGILVQAVGASGDEASFIPASADDGGFLVRAGGTCTIGGPAMITTSGKFIDWTAGNTVVGFFETGTTTDLDLVRMIPYPKTQRAAGPFFGAPALLAASGAIPVRPSTNYMITKAGVAAMTIAAPTAGTDDGVTIVVSSDTANAHTITFTGNTLDSGSASVATATFAAQKGAGVTLFAFNGRWKALSQIGITFS